MEDGLRMERRRSPRESRESLRQVGRAQGEVRKPKCQRCVCLLLQDLLQSCSRGGEEESGRHVL